MRPRQPTGGRYIKRLIGNICLAIVLAAAQIAIVSHVDVDGHAVDSPCAICASASTLSAAAVSALVLSIPPARGQAPEPGLAPSIFDAPIYAQPARAPPASA